VSRELYCYAYVEAPFELVTRLLAEDAAAVLQGATDDAADQADQLSHPLRVNVGGFGVSKDVEIELGRFEPREVTRSVVPLAWRASGSALLFPELRAELEVAAVSFDPPLTQVSVRGSYEPPLGAVGAGADRVLLGRLAEATLHRFTHEVADALRRKAEGLPPAERV